MPGNRCAVALCENSWKKAKRVGKELRLHLFPKCSDIKKEWIAKCRRADSFNPDKSYICSDHFLESDYERNLQAELLGLPHKKQLKRTAIPTVKLTWKEYLNSPHQVSILTSTEIRNQAKKKISVDSTKIRIQAKKKICVDPSSFGNDTRQQRKNKKRTDAGIDDEKLKKIFMKIHSSKNKVNIEVKPLKRILNFLHKSTNDDFIFGRFVSNEIRSLSRPYLRMKLKNQIESILKST